MLLGNSVPTHCPLKYSLWPHCHFFLMVWYLINDFKAVMRWKMWMLGQIPEACQSGTYFNAKDFVLSKWGINNCRQTLQNLDLYWPGCANQAVRQVLFVLALKVFQLQMTECKSIGTYVDAVFNEFIPRIISISPVNPIAFVWHA